MFKLSPATIAFVSSLITVSVSQQARASEAVETVCSGGEIDTGVLQSLYKLGEELKQKKSSLTLPKDCLSVLKSSSRQLPNPYVGALELAAGKLSTSQFAHLLNDIQENLSKRDTTERALTDSSLVSYLRIGCGTDHLCVKEIVNLIENFHAEQSPVFCDFAPKPDPAVNNYFNSFSYAPMPVNCQYKSTLGGNKSVTALDDWFGAFEKLRK
ncbi:hypothetical protein CAP48_17170 [Advenella sp. S44]|uniref:hypothetical protein n=1 Tax=Advenella sp. S44 TaxID=1982755 RepID=UPI000C2974FA|nr:hypothetical protein [Advenella sp. S44]PJX21045.1 hypothetical protein CAP48_17170 [Advenella sp. S44]